MVVMMVMMKMVAMRKGVEFSEDTPCISTTSCYRCTPYWSAKEAEGLRYSGENGWMKYLVTTWKYGKRWFCCATEWINNCCW